MNSHYSYVLIVGLDGNSLGNDASSLQLLIFNNFKLICLNKKWAVTVRITCSLLGSAFSQLLIILSHSSCSNYLVALFHLYWVDFGKYEYLSWTLSWLFGELKSIYLKCSHFIFLRFLAEYDSYLSFLSTFTWIISHNIIFRLNGMVDCGDRHKHIYQRAMLLVEQVKVSKGSPLVTCLLEGSSGR